MDSSTTVSHDHLELCMVNFNPIDKDYIVSWQSDLENTKESIPRVCDKPYHKIKENMPLGEEHEKLWNYPFPDQTKSRISFLLKMLPDN